VYARHGREFMGCKLYIKITIEHIPTRSIKIIYYRADKQITS